MILPTNKQLAVLIFFYIPFYISGGIFVPVTNEDLKNVSYNRGDTFLECLQNNQEVHQKRILQTSGIEPTSENLDNFKEIMDEDRRRKLEDLPKARSLFDCNPKELLQEFKYPLIISGAALTFYSCLMLKLYCAKNFVNKEVTWSSFYKSLPIESLYEILPEKFLADLEVVIYRTFVDDEKNINYKDTEPLYLFVKAVERELKNLEKFVNLYWYCSLPVISFLFPNYDEELIVAQEKIERLLYMKDLVGKKLIELHL